MTFYTVTLTYYAMRCFLGYLVIITIWCSTVMSCSLQIIVLGWNTLLFLSLCFTYFHHGSVRLISTSRRCRVLQGIIVIHGPVLLNCVLVMICIWRWTGEGVFCTWDCGGWLSYIPTVARKMTWSISFWTRTNVLSSLILRSFRPMLFTYTEMSSSTASSLRVASSKVFVIVVISWSRAVSLSVLLRFPPLRREVRASASGTPLRCTLLSCAGTCKFTTAAPSFPSLLLASSSSINVACSLVASTNGTPRCKQLVAEGTSRADHFFVCTSPVYMVVHRSVREKAYGGPWPPSLAVVTATIRIVL